MTKPSKLYIGAILLFGVLCIALPLPAPTPTANPLLTFIMFTTLATIAHLFYVEAPNHVAYFATPVFVYVGVLLLDQQVLAGMIIIYNLIEWGKERLMHGTSSERLRFWYMQPFNIAMELIASTAVRLLLNVLMMLFPHAPGAVVVLIHLVAIVTFVFLNNGMLGIVLVLARRSSWHDTGLLDRSSLLNDGILLMLGLVVAVTWEINPWLIAPALSPLFLMYRALQVPLLEQAAKIDSKTKLLNARYLQLRYDDEFARAQRFNRPLSVLMADLDYLRVINNTHGHLAGDAVIGGIGAIISQHTRSYDIAGRFGGEEFVIVLPETAPEEAFVIAERLRKSIEAARFAYDSQHAPIQATISIGVASMTSLDQSNKQLLYRADLAAYQAKAEGRNRVVIATEAHSVTETLKMRVVG